MITNPPTRNQGVRSFLNERLDGLNHCSKGNTFAIKAFGDFVICPEELAHSWPLN